MGHKPSTRKNEGAKGKRERHWMCEMDARGWDPVRTGVERDRVKEVRFRSEDSYRRGFQQAIMAMRWAGLISHSTWSEANSIAAEMRFSLRGCRKNIPNYGHFFAEYARTGKRPKMKNKKAAERRRAARIKGVE